MQPLIPPENISTKFLAAGRKYIHIGLEGTATGLDDGSSGGGSQLAFNAGAMLFTNNSGSNPLRRVWWVYESNEEIGRLLKWLDPRDADERWVARHDTRHNIT